MFVRRTAVAKAVMLALLVAVVPACSSKNKKTHPVIIDSAPAVLAGSVPRHPLLLLEFDQAMDGSTINSTNIRIFETISLAPFGPGAAVSYIPGSFQALIVPNGALVAGMQYDIVIFPQVTAANGLWVLAPVSGGIANRFTVVTPGNDFKPTFTSPPTAAPGGAQGTITLTWPQAQENGSNISADYDIYLALESGGYDFLATPFVTTQNIGGITLGSGGNGTLTPGTTYFFRIICRDSVGNVTVTNEVSAQATP